MWICRINEVIAHAAQLERPTSLSHSETTAGSGPFPDQQQAAACLNNVAGKY